MGEGTVLGSRAEGYQFPDLKQGVAAVTMLFAKVPGKRRGREKNRADGAL
jgi:hypothetical protein